MTTTAKKSIHAKLAEVQANLKAPKGQYNDFSKFEYRSAEDIIEAVKPLLYANELTMTISDKMIAVNDRIYVEATVELTNEDSETITTTAYAREELTKKGMDSAQITGSASSYARKYALNGMFAIDNTKDADSHDNREHVSETTTAQHEAIHTPPTDKQIELITSLAKQAGYRPDQIEEKLQTITSSRLASATIAKLQEDNSRGE